MSLNAEETRSLLNEVTEAYRAQINDVLLAALCRALRRWAGGGPALVEVEGHGREEVAEGLDLSRTVGWFTSLFPVLLDIDGAADAASALKAVKEQLRAVPNRGIGYGLLRYCVGEGRAEAPRAEVGFNYLGQFDRTFDEGGLFTSGGEPAGAARSPRSPRPHLLSVNGGVFEGRLQFGWKYGRGLHREETIARVAGWFIEELQAIIKHSRGLESVSYSPSDFPGVKLTQGQLDAVLKRVNKGKQLGK